MVVTCLVSHFLLHNHPEHWEVKWCNVKDLIVISNLRSYERYCLNLTFSNYLDLRCCSISKNVNPISNGKKSIIHRVSVLNINSL